MLKPFIRQTFLFSVIFVLISHKIKAQYINKQHNTIGSELYADAPYRVKKYHTDSTTNSLPVHFYIHDSNDLLNINQLMYIDIRIKNALDTSFTTPLSFNQLNDSSFFSYFSNVSVDDPVFGIQDFWASDPQKSTQHTVIFTKDENFGIPPILNVNITKPYFYFSFNIPGYVLDNYDDVVDIEVKFGLYLVNDQKAYLRVHRSELSLPSVTDWYRGDVHYHSMFTQNTAENGFPLEAVKSAAGEVGLDWITVTDHSCDFDNYGSGMQDNWQRLGNKVMQLNNEDSSFILIRGMELSLNNSNGKIIHSLIYPNETFPFDMPYIGDGGGDVSSTNVNVDMMLDSLNKYKGFCYAAHPFAEMDALSDLINGGIWNLNDSLLPENGNAYSSVGTIISNDRNIASDVFHPHSDTLLKSNLRGFQIWNAWRSLMADDNPYNPWDVMYQNSDAFYNATTSEPTNDYYRFRQNLDNYKVILHRGLIEKNLNPLLENWKAYISGGSDAHGDFNYSNTSYISYLGITYDHVSDNAIGKINTLAYCPNGMGAHGTNVLKALKNGNTVISSGPVVTISVTENGQTKAICGNDYQINDVTQSQVQINTYNNDEFGTIESLKLIAGTLNDEYEITLPLLTSNALSISDLITYIPYSILNQEWFYIRAEMHTRKAYTAQEEVIFKKHEQLFHCFTNPIWLKGNLYANINSPHLISFKLYPNPAQNFLVLETNKEIKIIEIYTPAGKFIQLPVTEEANRYIINTTHLAKGLYFIRITTTENTSSQIFIKE